MVSKGQCFEALPLLAAGFGRSSLVLVSSSGCSRWCCEIVVATLMVLDGRSGSKSFREYENFKTGYIPVKNGRNHWTHSE